MTPAPRRVTRGLAAALNAPAVLSTFSRLLIDPNRGADDPTLIMRLSDGAVLPGNANVDEAERARRIARFYAPYHAAIDAAIEAALATGVVPAIFSVHSFTPVWRGVPRPWHAGVLWDQDPRLAVPFIDALRADPALIVGDNEPYAGALLNDTMYQHATQRGLAHALVEVRQDLIADDAGIAEWDGAYGRHPAAAQPAPVDPSHRALRFAGRSAVEAAGAIPACPQGIFAAAFVLWGNRWTTRSARLTLAGAGA